MPKDDPAKEITPKAQTGRPTLYTEERAASIIEGFAEGRPVRKICEDHGITRATFYEWVTVNRSGFSDALAHARAARALALVERGGETLDDVDLTELDARLANASVNLAERKAAHARWIAERLDRQAWGDRTEVHLTGSVDMRGTLGSPLLGTGGRVVEARVVEPEGEDE